MCGFVLCLYVWIRFVSVCVSVKVFEYISLYVCVTGVCLYNRCLCDCCVCVIGMFDICMCACMSV